MKNVFAVLCALVMSVSAHAAVWTPGYMQGINTYYLPLDLEGPASKGYLELNCAGGEVSPPSVYASFDGSNTMTDFTVYVDNGTIDGMAYEFIGNALSTRQDFREFYNSVRYAKTIEISAMVNGTQNSQAARIEKNGEEAMPAADSDSFACTEGTPAAAPAVAEESAVAPASSGPALTQSDFNVFVRYNGSFNELHITSKLDDVKITGLTLNRGNCTVLAPTTMKMPSWWRDPAYRSHKFPTNLKFAQEAMYLLAQTAGCRELLEFIVHTDHGDVGYARIEP